MKIKVNEDYKLVFTEAFDGVIFTNEKNEIFKICTRNDKFKIEYNGSFFEAEKGEITKNHISGLVEEEKNCGAISIKEGESNIEIVGPEGSFEENNVGYGDFDANRVYKQKDICTWAGFTWRFVGKAWAVNPHGDRTLFSTQKKTIGVFPSESMGWRKI